MNRVYFLADPGFYQLTEKGFVPVERIDYSQEWFQCLGPCKVCVSNGKIDRVTYINEKSPNGICEHKNVKSYYGFLEAFSYCEDCQEKINE